MRNKSDLYKEQQYYIVNKLRDLEQELKNLK